MLDDTILSALQEALETQEETGLTVTQEGPEEVHLEGELNLRELAAAIAPMIDLRAPQVLSALREALEGPDGLRLELEAGEDSDNSVDIDDLVNLRQLAEAMAAILAPDAGDDEEE